MNIPSVAFLGVAAALVLLLPRRFAALPLLAASAYTTRASVVDIGLAHLSVLRVVILCGFVRTFARGERLANGANDIDRWLLAWAVLLIGMSSFHTSDAWTYRIGMVLGEVGLYVLLRVFLQNTDDLRTLFAAMCVMLLPLASLLLLEKATAHNYFDVLGAASEANIREGRVRATGPFAHAILAGTVGAMCVPMALCLWRTHRRAAILGIAVGLAILFASTSSGPIMMLFYVLLVLPVIGLRAWLSHIRWAVFAAIVVLQIVMNDPVYFLMARIDITGGSTGYYRAQLIRSALEHLSEWWAVGTDRTRHWMATGIHANDIHADIVNHYLAMGVMGGLPLLLTFILLLTAVFRRLGRELRSRDTSSPQERFLVWTVGAMLFGQVMSFWAISPYDQSASFFYLILAAAGAIPLHEFGVGRLSAAARAVRLSTAPLLSPARRRRWGTASPISRRFVKAAAVARRTQFAHDR